MIGIRASSPKWSKTTLTFPQTTTLERNSAAFQPSEGYQISPFQAESNELRERCNELQEAASNSKRLQDEVDELRYKVTSTGKFFRGSRTAGP